MTRQPKSLTNAEIVAEYELLTAINQGPAHLAAHLYPDRYRLRSHAVFLSEFLSTGVAEPRARLGISTPPQVGKSALVSEWLIVWSLTRNPHHRYLVISHSEDLALRASKSIRRIIREHGTRLGLILEHGSTSAQDWQLVTGGGVRAAGIGGGITGQRAHGIVTDDVIKGRIEASSRRVRDTIWDQLLSNVRTRLTSGWWVDVATRWHPDDMQARLRHMSGESWRFVELPAFARHGDAMGREPGQPLTHPEHADNDTDAQRQHWESIREALRSRPREYAALYMCDPQPDTGTLVERATLEAAHRTGEPVEARSVLAIDPADADTLTEGDNNGITHVVRATDGLIWVMGDYTMPGPIETWTARVVDLADRLEIDEIVYERNKGGRAVAVAIKSAWSAAIRRGDLTRPCPSVTSVTATKNKITRASPVAGMIADGEVVFGGYFPELEEQLATYEPGSPDSPDNMDAMVWGVTHLYRPKTRAAAKPSAGAGSIQIRPTTPTLPNWRKP